jgi:hypothetical protein
MRIIVFLLYILLVILPNPVFAVHSDTAGTKCLDCHFTLPFDRTDVSFTAGVGNVCLKCHRDNSCLARRSDEGFFHPIDVVPSMYIPVDMPLNKIGEVTCITCHSYHAEFWEQEYQNEFILRRPKGVKFCRACHKKL